MSCSEILLYPARANPSAAKHLIFFITGNPGLISYYEIFLSALNKLVSTSTSQHSYYVYGRNLAGFTASPSPDHPNPYSLEDQITILLDCLKSQVLPETKKPYESVILIGHSVGSYILLELIARLQKTSSTPHIIGGILLFPTVTYIARSPSGAKFTALLKIPDFPRRASQLANVLLWGLPKSAVEWLVRIVIGMPPEAAAVTTQFLKSSMGIYQALYLAEDEMKTITEDQWNEDIWSIKNEIVHNKKPPKLLFFFGKNDHWVADSTRDEFIAARGVAQGDDESSKPIMIVDEDGIHHSFCITQSETVAEKVKIWIDLIMKDSS